MKDIFKGVAVKIVSLIIIIVILCGGGFLLYRNFANNLSDTIKHETANNVEIVREKLQETAELNTGSYLCTDVLTRADSRKFKDWKIPFTEKSFIVSYDGVVKAGIKDLTKAKITESGNTIIVRLPEVEITETSIDNDSFEKLDESNNIFNPISIEDLNEAQKELKEKMVDRAIEKGVLDIAESNAETIIAGMLENSNDDYEIKVEWE